MTSLASAHLRLADGVIYATDAKTTSLLDIGRSRRRRVSAAVAGLLEQLVAGRPVPAAHPLLQPLVHEGYVTAGEPAADPILRSRLARLGAYYFDQYEAGLHARARAAYETTLLAHAWRKRLLGSVGQCPVLPETALRRALLLGDAATVGRQRVLCFGDDDFVAVPLAALGHEVVVADVDPYLLELLGRIGAALGLEIGILGYDAGDPLPADVPPFDAFVTDPMSNRACFELFLARAVGLLRPGGRGFVAVAPPAGRLFAQIAAAMQLDIAGWWRNHNRYYSALLELHPYTSDWVEVRATARTVLPHAPSAPAAAADLYRDDYSRPAATLFDFFDGIDVEHAYPLFLDILLEALATRGGLTYEARYEELAQDWSVLHRPTADGYVTLHVDRRLRQLTLSLHPFTSQREKAARDLVVAGHLSALVHARAAVGASTWDLRVR